MGLRKTVKEAASITGLSEYGLRVGIKNGKYPYIRVGAGASRGKILIDIDLLEEALSLEAQQNMSNSKIDEVPETLHYGILRKVKA